MKNIAVLGCTLKLSQGTGAITITSVPSLKSFTSGKAIYRGNLSFTVSGFTGGDITVPGSGTGSGSIVSTATKNKADGQFVMLEGDKATGVVITGLKPAGTSTVPAFCTIDVEINNAGQSDARGN